MYSFFAVDRIGNILILSGREVKHYKVRRIQRKEEIIVFHEGRAYKCLFYKEEENKIFVKILEEIKFEEDKPLLHLLIAVPKDIKTMDDILRFANETGFTTLRPLITSRSFRKEDVIRRKMERWKIIVEESSKQALRPVPLKILDPVDINHAEVKGKGIIMDSHGNYLSLGDIIKFNEFTVAIGPEGGFSAEEIEIMKNKGFLPVKIKPYILRVETAVAVCGGLFSNLSLLS